MTSYRPLAETFLSRAAAGMPYPYQGIAHVDAAAARTRCGRVLGPAMEP